MVGYSVRESRGSAAMGPFLSWRGRVAMQNAYLAQRSRVSARPSVATGRNLTGTRLNGLGFSRG